MLFKNAYFPIFLPRLTWDTILFVANYLILTASQLVIWKLSLSHFQILFCYRESATTKYEAAPPELMSFIEKQEEYIEQLERESRFCRVSMKFP